MNYSILIIINPHTRLDGTKKLTKLNSCKARRVPTSVIHDTGENNNPRHTCGQTPSTTSTTTKAPSQRRTAVDTFKDQRLRVNHCTPLSTHTMNDRAEQNIKPELYDPTDTLPTHYRHLYIFKTNHSFHKRRTKYYTQGMESPHLCCLSPARK